MQVDQRHITTVNLYDGKLRDFTLAREARGYRLTCISKDEVVNIFLSAQDLYKLRQEIVRWDTKEFKKEYQQVTVEHDAAPRKPEGYIYQWSTADWLSFN